MRLLLAIIAAWSIGILTAPGRLTIGRRRPGAGTSAKLPVLTDRFANFSGGAVLWKASSAGIKNFVTFDWYPGSSTFGTGLPYSQWFCAISHVGGTWIVTGTSSSDNTGAFASIVCVQLGG